MAERQFRAGCVFGCLLGAEKLKAEQDPAKRSRNC